MLYNIIKFIVRWTSDEQSDGRQIEFGMEWNCTIGIIWYSIDDKISDSLASIDSSKKPSIFVSFPHM
jgi:hypothetical protein